jgi:O-antigen ligase
VAALIGVSCVALFSYSVIASGDGGFYDNVAGRLFADDEGTRDTLGSRTIIWRSGIDAVISSGQWLLGLGVGGVDKVLGGSYELDLFATGKDGIRRSHSHSTYVEWFMMLGALGILLATWLTMVCAMSAWRLDKSYGSVHRTGLLVFAAIYSCGGVINTEVFWIAFGSLLWSALSIRVRRTRVSVVHEFVGYAGQMGHRRSKEHDPLNCCPIMESLVAVQVNTNKRGWSAVGTNERRNQ